MARAPVNIGDSAILGDGRRDTRKDNLGLFWVGLARLGFDHKPFAGCQAFSRCREETVKNMNMLDDPLISRLLNASPVTIRSNHPVSLVRA